jgi:hypothetical protein
MLAVHGRDCSHELTTIWISSMNRAAASGPASAKIRCTSPPSTVPNERLHR